jgi:hypothetical protein
VNSRYFTVWKSGGIEARRLMRVLVEQRQIVFFGFMLVCSLCSIRPVRRGLGVATSPPGFERWS